MNYFVRCFFLSIFFAHIYIYADNVSSHTFLTAQPFLNMANDMTYTMIMDQYYENGSVLNKPQIQASFFYGSSTNSDAISEFFLFNNKKKLKMIEAVLNDTDTVQDIIGLNFNITTQGLTSSSLLSLDPHEDYWSLGINGRYALHERGWVSFQIPFLSITHDLGIKEEPLFRPNNLSDFLGFDGKYSNVGSMVEAFRQPDMLYGKIDGPQKKHGFGDITLMAGYDFDDRSDHYLSPYIGVTLPTSNKPTAKYMWEPILGNNKHFGIFAGAYGHSQIYEKNNKIVWFTWSLKNEYLFPNIQKRSFDLYKGPWTRYLAMYKNDSDRLSPISTFDSTGLKTFGINIMTQDAQVSPGFSNTSTMSFSYTNDGFYTTLGASSFIRETEVVRLAKPWKQGPSVASFGGNAACSYLRNISNFCWQDGEVAHSIYITENDINLNSAATPNIIVGGIYTALGYYFLTEHPQLYELGFSYETSRQNSAIDRYAFWAKFQITF